MCMDVSESPSRCHVSRQDQIPDSGLPCLVCVWFTVTNDYRVIFVKLADRLHNMKTLDSMPAVSQAAGRAHAQPSIHIETDLPDSGGDYLPYSETDFFTQCCRVENGAEPAALCSSLDHVHAAEAGKDQS